MSVIEDDMLADGVGLCLYRPSRIRGLLIRVNAHVAGRWLDTQTRVDTGARTFLAGAATRLRMSARGYHRALKVARTIADLDGDDAITLAHVAEALRFRTTDHLPRGEAEG